MSRSYKKHPYCTDGRSPTPRQMKSIANRSVRRYNKRVVKGWLMRDPKYKNYMTLDGKSYKRYFCSYDIHDYISRWSKTEALYEYHHPNYHYIGMRGDNEGYWWSTWEDYTEKEFINYWAKCYRRK